MSTVSPYIPGHYLLHLMETDLLPTATVARLEAHLRKTGLDPLQLSDARLSPQSLEALLHAWPEIAPRRLAIQFGHRVTLTSQGNLSLLLMTAPTLRHALQLHGFLPLLTNAATLQYFETESGGHLQVQPHSGSPLLDELLVLYACAGLLRLASLLTGVTCHGSVSIASEYSHALPPEAEDWAGDAMVSSVVFPKALLDTPLQHADAITHAQLVQQCERQQAQHEQGMPLVSRIRQLLRDGRTEPDQESVARALNLSRSSLKRQLSRHHTHFQAVLTDFRKENAIRLLLGTPLSLEQIAEQLGYSDQTNFSHAFRHWSGMTPGQFRKHSR